MGSLGAMKAARSRRTATSRATSRSEQAVAEGIEGRVPYKGPLGSCSTSSSAGCARRWATAAPQTSRPTGQRALHARVAGAGLRESHPHDVVITKEAPNYGLGRG